MIAIPVDLRSDPRKGRPYAAVIHLDDTGRFIRRFIETLHRDWGKHELRLTGTITVPAGAIVELREGASWKNDYRYWYLVQPDGLHRIGRHDDTDTKVQVRTYLQGGPPPAVASDPDWPADGTAS